MNEHPWTVLIAERGWIYAGRTHREGDRIIIEDGYIVRRFSLETKDGIGGLAARGPKKGNDILDACPLPFRVFVFTVLGDFDCDRAAWARWHEAQSKKAEK